MLAYNKGHVEVTNGGGCGIRRESYKAETVQTNVDEGACYNHPVSPYLVRQSAPDEPAQKMQRVGMLSVKVFNNSGSRHDLL